MLPLPSVIRTNIDEFLDQIKNKDLYVEDWLHSLSEATVSAVAPEPVQAPSPNSADAMLQGSETHPAATDLHQNLTALADSYLQRLSEEFLLPSNEEAEALKADPERASLAVTALFLALLREAKKQALPPWVGNPVVELVAFLGPRFVPDITALFELYLAIHGQLQSYREKWDQTNDEVGFLGSPYLAVGWQLAWTISRAGTKQVLASLRPGFTSSNTRERLAAVNVAEDALRYARIDRPPMFGGGTGPPEVNDNRDERMEMWTNPGQKDDYQEMTVFYGTDRNASDKKDAARYYGGNRGERLELGLCTDSILQKKAHKKGELETPTIWRFEVREDPAKHVVLLTVKPYHSQDQFTAALRVKVKSSPKKQALVFVHGYRVTFEDAARRTAQLAYDLSVPEAPIVPIFYSWPSQGKFLSYGADQANAANAKPHLKKFLTLLAEESGAKIIHLVAHSMGNQALTDVLVQPKAFPAKAGVPLFKEIILTAPDIDAGVFKN